MTRITFNSLENILYIKREGDILADEIISSIGDIFNLDINVTNLYILDDSRKTNTAFDHFDHNTINKEAKRLLNKFKKVTIAHTVDRPTDTALSMLYSADYQSKKFDFKTFSDLKSAKDWLLNNM